MEQKPNFALTLVSLRGTGKSYDILETGTDSVELLERKISEQQIDIVMQRLNASTMFNIESRNLC